MPGHRVAASDVEDLSILEHQLEELQREIDGYRVENEIFTSYYERMVKDKPLEELTKKGRQKGHGRTKHPINLTIEQKVDIANSEHEEIQKQLEEQKKNSEKLIDTLRSVLEENEMRISELKKDAYEFRRDVVVGAENMRTGKTMAEKVLRYFEDKLRSRDAAIEKLRLKNATLKTQRQKVEAQLRQKEEMGDVLHYIDFHQLQIENKQHVARIEERNEELLKLKMMTGKTVQALNMYKHRLQHLQQEREWLNKEIAARQEALGKMTADNEAVTGDIGTDKKLKKKLTQQKEDTSGMPQVLDYIGQKAEMYELQDAVRNWERKVEIATMAAKRARMQERSLSQSLQSMSMGNMDGYKVV